MRSPDTMYPERLHRSGKPLCQVLPARLAQHTTNPSIPRLKGNNGDERICGVQSGLPQWRSPHQQDLSKPQPPDSRTPGPKEPEPQRTGTPPHLNQAAPFHHRRKGEKSFPVASRLAAPGPPPSPAAAHGMDHSPIKPEEEAHTHDPQPQPAPAPPTPRFQHCTPHPGYTPLPQGVPHQGPRKLRLYLYPASSPSPLGATPRTPPTPIPRPSAQRSLGATLYIRAPRH